MVIEQLVVVKWKKRIRSPRCLQKGDETKKWEVKECAAWC